MAALQAQQISSSPDEGVLPAANTAAPPVANTAVANTALATTANTAAVQPASTATSNDYQGQINAQLSQLSQPTDANSAVVRNQTDAYNLQSDRGLATNENAIAE